MIELRSPLAVWLEDHDGWTEMAGGTSLAIERHRQPIDDWIEGNGTGEMRGLIAMYAEPYDPTPIERALDILRPHLTTVPLYRA